MILTMLVENQPPETSGEVSPPLLELFQEYTGDEYLPFKHQAEAFHLVGHEGKESFLVAGTASGKTLAIAIPLFWKLSQGIIKKVLFIYPTVALLEDQRKVMDHLAEITGLDVGQIQGGMSKSKLIAALNKPVILATPDEIYWFFRKNVKYNSLLIYGLALVDEFVLDEAHLFNGLMLRNLSHLKSRIQLLAKKLDKIPRWHVLTATPTENLKRLTTGEEVHGKSKCGDVEVTFLEPAKRYDERRDKLVDAVETALQNGSDKVLLVFNSADLAHRVFEGVKGRRSRPDIPPDLKIRFGRIRWRHFKAWSKVEGISSEVVEEIEGWLKREEIFHLKDLEDGAKTSVPTETLASKVSRILENQVWVLKRMAYSAEREGDSNPVEAIERRLAGKSKTTRLVWDTVRPAINDGNNLESLFANLKTWVGDVQGSLERIWVEDSLEVTAQSFNEITEAFQAAGMGRVLAENVTNNLTYSIELPEYSASNLKMVPSELGQRYLAFSWLGWMVNEENTRANLIDRVRKALEDGRLEVEMRHISAWGDSDLPVVIYTGKMSKPERRGLLEAFEKLSRAVLISTPAVEVGVDFAADALITEQCDGNGFLQRFGRVGRRSGVQANVVALVKDGETYVELFNRCRSGAGDDGKIKMMREEFSSLISDPVDGVFPAKLCTEGSDLLDAIHYMVNAQLGEIGIWLNQAMFDNDAVKELAEKLREADLSFAYGLRGTMPGVALRGGAGGGEPFYVLRKIYNDRLMASSSPFEMAQSDMWHMELLWTKYQWDIVIDPKATLESSQALFWLQDGRWHLRAGYGIAADYVRLFQLESNLRALEPELRRDLGGFLEKLEPHASNPKVRPILRVGEALPLFFLPHAKFILGQGDVHLLRQDQEGIIESVEDRLGNPLVLENQVWLILYGHRKEEAERLLNAVSALGLEELYYDWQTLEGQGGKMIGPVLLDRAAGACFDVYRRLVEHAG